jgi:hypothetical protein
MRAIRGSLLFCLFPVLTLVFLFLPLFPQASSPPSFRPAPLWWEIAIDLKTEGEYKLESNNFSYIGNYIFLIRWTGCLEKDDHDYLLYRFDCRLADWKAQETATSPEASGVLTTSDFKEKPSFNLKYILRKGADLCLDFIANGIVVPQDGAEESIELLFPSSEENKQHDFQVDYNTGVTEGSNSVSLKEAEIYAGPVTKDYFWTWKHQQWQLMRQRTVLTAQSHRARVSLSIIPHYARPK